MNRGTVIATTAAAVLSQELGDALVYLTAGQGWLMAGAGGPR